MFNYYKALCRKVLEGMDRWGYNKASRAVVSLLAEPLAVFKSAFNWRERGNTSIPGSKRAFLLIHGNHHNSSAWVDFKRDLIALGDSSVFTVDLPSGPITPLDLALVKGEMKRISTELGDIAIDLIGHSRGANVAFLAALEEGSFSFDENGSIRFASALAFRKEVKKLIGIAHPYQKHLLTALSETDRNKILEVVAERDVLVLDKSHLPEEQIFTSKAGHVGVLYDKSVIDWVNS